MGLDGVELLIAVEKEFGIAIDDADAVRLTTPAQVADLVMTRLALHERGAGAHTAQAAFHRLRSVLIEDFGAERAAVQLQAPIAQFLRGELRPQWRTLQQALDANELPPLQCSRPLAFILMLGLPAAAGAGLIALHAQPWTAALVCATLSLGGSVAARRLADQLPLALRTIADLVPYVGQPDRRRWTRDYVLQRVLQITATQLGLDARNIKPDDHFVEDLGLNA